MKRRVVVQELIVATDQPFTRRQRVGKSTLVEMLEYPGEEMLFVERTAQTTLQLLRGERFDQIIVGRQFGHRNDVVVGAFSGDHHVYRR